MDAWGWIVVYAVGLTVLQLLVYRYLLNGGGAVGYDAAVGRESEEAPNGDGAAPASGREFPGTPRLYAQDRHQADVSESTERYCPHCGAENEPDRTFDRCWNCANRIA
jgi:hypothetical protein